MYNSEKFKGLMLVKEVFVCMYEGCNVIDMIKLWKICVKR